MYSLVSLFRKLQIDQYKYILRSSQSDLWTLDMNEISYALWVCYVALCALITFTQKIYIRLAQGMLEQPDQVEDFSRLLLFVNCYYRQKREI
jgi:hypothetical protein